MRYKIIIEEPCSENWNEMSTTQKGAFCKSCEKEVIDFTNVGAYTLAKKVQNNENICGRFKPEQLNVPLPKVNQGTFRRNAMALGFTSLLALSAPLTAQEKPEKPNPTSIHTIDRPVIMGRIAIQHKPIEVVTITGVVMDLNTPLVGANVLLNGTEISIKTNANGEFSLIIPNQLLSTKNILSVSYRGYLNQELKINAETKHLDVNLESALMIMGGIGVVEHPELSLIEKAKNIFKTTQAHYVGLK